MGIKTLNGNILHNDSGNMVDVCHVAVPECPFDRNEWTDLVDNGTPCHGIVQSYSLVGYSDGDLTGHPHCADSVLDAWGGVFTAHAIVGTIRWGCFFQGTLENLSIDGKLMTPNRTGISLRRLVHPPRDYYWSMFIQCAGRSIWRGRKYYGLTPAGIYTWNAADCTWCSDTTPSLVVVGI